MEIAMKDGQILMRNLDSVQYQMIAGTGKARWDKKKQMLIGPVSLELLDFLGRIIKLPPKIDAEHKRLKAIQVAIDDQRMDEHPEPLVHYPVKLPLFEHQVRGANMALLTFGVVEPPKRKVKCATCCRNNIMLGCEMAMKYGNAEIEKSINKEPDGRIVDCRFYKKKEGGNNG